MIEAAESGERVEDESQRTEKTQVFANPDGTWTMESATNPVRVEDSAGEWHDIDLTLIERDGRIEPRYAAAEVSFSDGGDRTLAAVSDNGRDLEWKLPGDASALPAPVLEGSTATYKNVAPNQDLVVEAQASGFAHFLILHERPNFAAGDAAVIEMPVVTDGAVLREQVDGGLEVETKSGEFVASAPPPLMWDATTTQNGDPANVAEVEATVTPPGQTTPEGLASGTSSVVTLTPDEEFLADPDTVYPVTIDPTYTTEDPTNNGDTFIDNDNTASGHYTGNKGSGAHNLRVGTSDGGTIHARTFVKFPHVPVAGKKIISATLKARVVKSLSCTNGTNVAYRLTANWAADSTLAWNDQPAVDTNDAPQAWLPHGGPSGSACAPHGWAEWNVKPAVEKWQLGGTANAQYGFRIQAATLFHGSYREYRSVNATPDVTTYHPRLVVTYNTRPSAPTGIEIAPSVAGVIDSLTPTISAQVSDPDGGIVRALVAVHDTSGEELWSAETPFVPSAGRVSIGVPPGVVEVDGVYEARVTAWDGEWHSLSDTRLQFHVLPNAPENHEEPKVDVVDASEGPDEAVDAEVLADLEATTNAVTAVGEAETAGAWVAEDQETIVAGITTPDAQEEVAASVESLDIAAVSFEQVSHSKDELDQIVEHVYEQPGLESISSAKRDLEQNRVILTSSEPVTDELAAAVYSAYGDAAALESEPVEPVTMSRDRDHSPFYAGAAFGRDFDDRASCTLGWSWVAPTGAARMLTAGHCHSSGEAWANNATNYVRTFNYYVGRMIGTTETRSGPSGNDGDLALIDTTRTVDGRIILNRSGAPRMFTGGPTSATSTTVNSVDLWTVKGTKVCYSGMMRGVQCGHSIDGDGNGGYVVEDKDASYRSDTTGYWYTHVALAEKGWGKCIIKGDSGSPVYINTPGVGVAAHGILSGGGTTVGQDDYISRFEPGKCRMWFTEIGQAYQRWNGHVEIY